MKYSFLSLQHVIKFFKTYDLDFRYDKLEHKPKHVAIKMVYLRKADNSILVSDDQGKFTRIFRKQRGIKQDETRPNPLAMMMDEGLLGNNNPKNYPLRNILKKKSLHQMILKDSIQEHKFKQEKYNTNRGSVWKLLKQFESPILIIRQKP